MPPDPPRGALAFGQSHGLPTTNFLPTALTVAPLLVNCTLGSVVMSFGVPGGEPTIKSIFSQGNLWVEEVVYNKEITESSRQNIIISSTNCTISHSPGICTVIVSLTITVVHSTVPPFKAVFAVNVNTEDVIPLPLPVAVI